VSSDTLHRTYMPACVCRPTSLSRDLTHALDQHDHQELVDEADDKPFTNIKYDKQRLTFHTSQYH